MVKYYKIESIEPDGFEDVYCMCVPKNGNFVANSIVVKNCDALRYGVASTFPTGELLHAEELRIEDLRRQVYGDNDSISSMLGLGHGGF